MVLYKTVELIFEAIEGGLSGMDMYDNIVDSIGNTPLIRLRSIDQHCGAEILGKAELMNPGGSVKDRIGRQMILEAEKEGLLDEDSIIVEPTSGNTGIALAMVSAARNYDLVLTMPDRMSLERRSMLRGLGAELELTPGAHGMEAAVERANEITGNRERAVMLDQFTNPANPKVHYQTTGPEIWEATDGNVDAIVTGVGTGGTITGVGRYIREKKEDFQIIAVEPEESPVLSGGEAARHRIQGIGAGFFPEVLDTDLLDDVVTVDYDSAARMARRIGADEGIFVGISAGANVVGALRVGHREEFDGGRIVTTLCDTGERYLSTALYRHR